MKRITMIGAALAWMATACGGISTNVDWDPAQSFGQLNSYDWIDQDLPEGIPESTIDVVRSTADEELQAKGYRKASDDPSFLVGFQLGTQAQTAYRTYSNPFSPGRYAQATAGTRLAIDVIEPGSRQAVWSGSASVPVDLEDVHKNAPPIREAVRKLLAEFPPDSAAIAEKAAEDAGA